FVKIIKGLNTEVIARDKQCGRAGAQIADSESKHPVQTLYAIHAFLLIKAKNYFRVRMRRKVVALAFKFAPKFGEVVDLSVVSDPDRAILIAHWHVADGRQVKNRQAPAAKTSI